MSDSMPYNETFYKMYEEYLKEKTVRIAHDYAIDALVPFAEDDCFEKVVDLGCGHSREWFRYGEYFDYVGVDENIENVDRLILGTSIGKLICGNYRGNLKSLLAGYEPTVFVSLFSTEITAPWEDNYRFYRHLFDIIGVRAGLVAGFYYSDRIHENPVKETGGIISYQSLSSVEAARVVGLHEIRLTLPVPSKLFGPDVVEVWKFLSLEATEPCS